VRLVPVHSVVLRRSSLPKKVKLRSFSSDAELPTAVWDGTTRFKCSRRSKCLSVSLHCADGVHTNLSSAWVGFRRRGSFGQTPVIVDLSALSPEEEDLFWKQVVGLLWYKLS
jgi:hypothetical protein